MRDQVGVAYSSGHHLSSAYHVPGTAQDPVFPKQADYYQPHFADGKTKAQSKLPKAMQQLWSGFGLHRPSTGSSGPLSVLCLPPGHSNLTAPVCTGPLLQAGLRDLA